MRTSELQGSSLLFLYRFERACQKCDIYLGNPPHFCLSLLLYDCARLLVQYCLSQTFLKIAVQCFLSSWSNIERKCSRPGWIVHTLYCVHFRLSSKELGLTKLNVVMYPRGWKVPWMFSCQWDCCYYKSGKLISMVTMSQFWTLAWMFYEAPRDIQAVAPLANSFEMHLWIIRLFSDPLLFDDTCTKVTLSKLK